MVNWQLIYSVLSSALTHLHLQIQLIVLLLQVWTQRVSAKDVTQDSIVHLQV